MTACRGGITNTCLSSRYGTCSLPQERRFWEWATSCRWAICSIRSDMDRGPTPILGERPGWNGKSRRRLRETTLPSRRSSSAVRTNTTREKLKMSLKDTLFTKAEQHSLFDHTFLARERLDEQYAAAPPQTDAAAFGVWVFLGTEGR